MPSLAIQERKGYSLPKNQTTRVWTGKSSGDSMPLSLRQVSIMTDFSNTWAMFTSGTPFSRDARAEGLQSPMTSAQTPAINGEGAVAGPAGVLGRTNPAAPANAVSLQPQTRAE